MPSPAVVISDDVRLEQVRALYRQTKPILLANACNSFIVVAALWSSGVGRGAGAPAALRGDGALGDTAALGARGAAGILVAWGFVMATVLAGRALLAARFGRAEVAAAEAQRWGVRFACGSALTGALWGALAARFFAGAGPTIQLLLSFTVGGMCAAAAGTLASYFPACLCFIVPALGALLVRTALLGSSLLTLSALIAVYGVALAFIARNSHRAVTAAFVLRFENGELLARLSRTRASLEESNRTLEQRVAERTKALQTQAEALRDARRLEAVGRLAGGVAHDFNNLLTVIVGNLSDVSRSRSLDATARAFLGEAGEAAAKGTDLVRQLLTFSRRQHTVPETFDLNAAVRGMERLLRRLIGERLTLQVALHPRPLRVHADPTEVEQVVMNLVTNARDAMPHGGIVRIETGTAEVGDKEAESLEPASYAVLSVRDTGVGMDVETRRRIFEPFFTTKEVGKGTGLGLATAYGIVQHGGGRLEVSSEVGRGSCFRVYLPSAPAEELAAASLAPSSRRSTLHRSATYPLASRAGRAPSGVPEPSGASEPSGGAPRSPGAAPRKGSQPGEVPPPSRPSRSGVASAAGRSPTPPGPATILLVEDDPSVRSVTHRMLAGAGHEVIAASNGAEALSVAARHAAAIDLLVTDVVMAGLDGPSLAQRLTEARPGLRTLFISGYRRDYAIPDAANGESAFLPKPFTRGELIAKVTEMLASTVRGEASRPGASA